MKSIILFLCILSILGCSAVWNTVKSSLPPYEFVGIDDNCRQVKFNIGNEYLEKNLYGNKVQEVWLAGSFNNWAQSKTNPVYQYGDELNVSYQYQINNKMYTGWGARIIMKLDEGTQFWNVIILLSPGRYQYKYIMNKSKWIEDDRTEYVEDGFSSKNSIITVPPFTAAEIEKYQIDTNLNK